MTAVKTGATVANYCEVTRLQKDESGRLNGAKVKDTLTGDEWNIRAKVHQSLIRPVFACNLFSRELSMPRVLSLTIFFLLTIPRINLSYRHRPAST